MELQKLNSKIPIKAIPEESLNSIILTAFVPWLSNLLSLTGETSAERLKTALPAIKKHCWSMGFVEIKTMFELYADGELSVQPRSNYFDRILLSQIVQAYKDRKRTKSPEKESNELPEVVYEMLDEYQETGKLTYKWLYMYQELRLKGKLPPHTTKYQEEVAERARQIHGKETTQDDCKMVVLIDYVKNLI